ncbi:unnamed protein product [Rhizoctonia solani]|uniref:Transcription factor spt8 beta-propeller domain-containing protein n=1 Tax=Rhizoctonia solani TaxID=456999 RepID=A0A8H2XL31_9AGAM|nr:unnamed protein product [Rhizoctonia solani]
MQALNYEDEEMEFEGSSPFNADDDDDEADTQSENSEPEEEPEPEPEPEPELGESGDESEQVDDSDQEHASSPPSEHENEKTTGNMFKKRQSPVMVPVITPVVPVRAASPAALRRAAFVTDISASIRSYSIDPICAYPHPVATHSLAASKCMTHLLTGSDDGYIRDYDFYAGCNGKVLLTAPQRQHCGLGEGVMKGGVLRMWWENPSGEGGSQPSGGDVTPAPTNVLEGGSPSPVYCMTLHSDALWGLSGTAAGNINLFTVRHDPGRVHFVLRGHKGPTSGLALSADEKKVYSAGWDGHALEWDLNVGQIVRRYPSHGAQLVSIGIRPISSNAADSSSPSIIPSTLPRTGSGNFNSTNGTDGTMGSQKAPTQMGGSPRSAEEDYDPLFDDPDLEASADLDQGAGRGTSSALAWRSAVPSLDAETYERYSHNILMTAAIDGQITIWDRRVAGSTPGSGVGRLDIPEKTPPWCVSSCWSADGSQLYAGRRNGTVEVWDMRQTRNTHEGTPRLLRTLRNPLSSGAVSCVVAFPDGKHLACASQDNIRLWNVSAEAQVEATNRSRVAPFKIIAGHHGGTISQILRLSRTGSVGLASSMVQLLGSQYFPPPPSLAMAAVAYHHRPPPVPTPPPHMHQSEMDIDQRPPSPTSSTSTVTSSRTPDFFRQLHDRQLNCMNTTYMLPADEQEMKRMDIEHRMMKFIMGGKNYVGPVVDALTKTPGVQRRVLDCGTGNGLWAIEMADEFDWVEVTGVDLAPVQPRKVPPNCVFELFDLDGQRLPYPDNWFDVVHARSVYTGVRHYSIFLRELARVLRPGGVAIFAEVDSTPYGEKKHRIPLEPRGGAPGWAEFWDQVRQALGQLGIDVSIPSQLRSRIRETREFENIVAQEALVPIGFWPKDEAGLERAEK